MKKTGYKKSRDTVPLNSFDFCRDLPEIFVDFIPFPHLIGGKCKLSVYLTCHFPLWKVTLSAVRCAGSYHLPDVTLQKVFDTGESEN